MGLGNQVYRKETAGFEGSAVTSGIIERETKQTWEEAGGGTKDMPPLLPGLLCFSALGIYLPQPRLARSAPLLPDMGLHTQLCAWQGARGDRETASDCWLLLGSVLMDFALPCSSTSSASCGTWEDVTHRVGCLEQSKGTVARRSSPEHQELPCPVENPPMFNFPLVTEAEKKKSYSGP